MPHHAKEYSFDVIEFTLRVNLLLRIWISQDVNESLEALLNVYNYADIFIEGAFRNWMPIGAYERIFALLFDF